MQDPALLEKVKSLEASLVEKERQLYRKTAEVSKLKKFNTNSLQKFEAEYIEILNGRDVVIAEMKVERDALVADYKELTERIQTIEREKEEEALIKSTIDSKVKQIKALKKNSRELLKEKKNKEIVERLYSGRRE